MEIRPAGAELLHSDRTNGQTKRSKSTQKDMTKLIATFCNFAMATKDSSLHINP